MGTKSATVKWNKVSGASGYEIYMSTTKTGKYTKIYTANSSTLNYKKSALTKNLNYNMLNQFLNKTTDYMDGFIENA